MAQLKRKDLETWIRKNLYVPREEGRCSKFILKHIGAGGKLGSEVHCITVPKNQKEAGDEFVETVMQELESNAHQDACGMPGAIQSYAVQAFFEDSEKPLSRYAFKVHGEDDEEGDSGASEPPNRIGITSQLMRHNEAMARTSFMATGQVLQTLMRQNASLTTLLEEMQKDKLRTFELVEDLMSQKHQRDLETNREERHSAMVQDAFDKLMTLAPVVIAKLGNSKQQKMLPPGAPDELELKAKALVESIQPDQLEALGQVLKPEQQFVMAEMFQTLQARDEARAQKQLPPKREGKKGK
jgi:hypothetical protein